MTPPDIETIKAAIAATEAELAEWRSAFQMQTNAQATPFGPHAHGHGHPHPVQIQLEQRLRALQRDLTRAENPS